MRYRVFPELEVGSLAECRLGIRRSRPCKSFPFVVWYLESQWPGSPVSEFMEEDIRLTTSRALKSEAQAPSAKATSAGQHTRIQRVASVGKLHDSL
jgi:hypothetical protein